MRQALSRIAAGGYAEAVVRMMILLAAARGGVRRSRLARSNALMQNEPPFAGMTASARQALIREQTVIASMAPAEALSDPAEAAAEARPTAAAPWPRWRTWPARRRSWARRRWRCCAQLRSALGLGGGLVPVGYETAAVPD